MIEIGRVIEIRGNRARIVLAPRDGCSACGKCILGREGKYMCLEAENIVEARAGDEVMVKVPHSNPLLAALILFGIPLLGLLAGGVAGYIFFRELGIDPNAGAGIIGLISMAGVFILLHLKEKRQLEKGEKRINIVNVIKSDPS